MAPTSDKTLINSLSEQDCWAILLYLCRDSETNEDVRKLANGLKKAEARGTEDAALYVQCDSPFLAQANKTNACLYHDGKLDVDYEGDFWADHDEQCHGTVDSDFWRREYPDGFVWTCCDALGSENGCTRGPHRELVSQA